MTRKEEKRAALKAMLSRMNGQPGQPDHNAARIVRMQLARLDDAEDIPGPESLVDMIASYLNDSAYFTLVVDRENRVRIKMTPLAEATFDESIREVIAEQIAASKQSRKAPPLGAELMTT